jgi:hypothetical protein
MLLALTASHCAVHAGYYPVKPKPRAATAILDNAAFDQLASCQVDPIGHCNASPTTTASVMLRGH